jgi:hypothetical protein
MRSSSRVSSETPGCRTHCADATIAAARGHLGLVDGDFDVLSGCLGDVDRHRHADHRHGEAHDNEKHARLVHQVPRAEGVRPMSDEKVEDRPS